MNFSKDSLRLPIVPYDFSRPIESLLTCPNDGKNSYYSALTSTWDLRSLVNASLSKRNSSKSRGFFEEEEEGNVVVRLPKQMLYNIGLMSLAIAGGYAMARFSR